ncbi:MAG TPA: hypothetical protein VKT73_13295 [Xanthobacteraceae bacterium]|nr:hypothetical protein [Xanthobacteraceae bacterium]
MEPRDQEERKPINPAGGPDNGRKEEQPRPFDSGWLERLPKEDDAPYRSWWVIDDLSLDPSESPAH